MSILNISIILILIIIVLFIVFYFNSQSNIIYDKLFHTNEPTNSANDYTIYYNDNKEILSNPTSNFSLSLWFFVTEWNTSNNKSILYISENKEISLLGKTSSTDPDLWIYMDKFKNILKINIKQTNSSTTLTADDGEINDYEIKNINLQKWNCLTISIDSHVMDVYINGKLRNSFVINNMFKRIHQEPDIYLGYPNDEVNHTSIDGYITRIRYYNKSISSQDAYNIYKEGINQSFLNKLTNNYNLKMSLIENGIEKAGILI